MSFRKLAVFAFVVSHAPFCLSASDGFVQKHSSPAECERSIAKIASEYERIRKLHNKEVRMERKADGKIIVDHGSYTETMYCDGATSHVDMEKK